MSIAKKCVAELIGTFWLVFGGCGTAVLASHKTGVVGVSLAFGLTVLTMAYAIGHISGCHLNPAVSLGCLVAKRMPAKDFVPYIISQCIGAIAASALLMVIVGKVGSGAGAFATNFYDANVYGTAYSLVACFIVEAVLTFIFLFVILGSTDARAPAGLAPIAIGLCLTLIHLISIPVTNTSVNPARSIAPALFVGGDALKQVWLFIVAPMVGAGLAGIVYPMVACCKKCCCEKKDGE